MFNSPKDRSGSSLIISVILTAIIIAASLSVSVGMVSVAQRAAQLSSSAQAFFAAEAGIEEGIYTLTGHGPGYEPADGEAPSETDFASGGEFSAIIDNLIESTGNPNYYTVTIPGSSSIAISLYYEDENEIEQAINVNDLDFELLIESYEGEDLRIDLEPDYWINGELDVDFMHPNLGEALVSPTIILRSTMSDDSTWEAGDDIYQKIGGVTWCPVYPDWSLEPTDCVDAGELGPNLTNLKVDTYPIEAGNPVDPDLMILEESVYDDEADFYLDNDGNELISISQLGKFFLTVEDAGNNLNFDYELDIYDFTPAEPYHFESSLKELSFRGTGDPSIITLDEIIGDSPSYPSYETPILVVSTYTIPFTLTITAADNVLPAIETSIVSHGERGNHQQKVEALLEQRENVPILHQTIVY